ncbi:hypothetical protein ABES38_11615 [Bacillus gobiensis]|uniref:hypothetical protein n=1 Tax=Bacillus gobiensis TaxID=1441095 RepID=UPI003D23B3F8
MENGIQASGFVIQPRLKFKNLKDKMLFQHLLDAANYQASNNCDRGQLILSILKLSEETGWERGRIRGSIGRLIESGLIQSEHLKQNKGTLITICDYEKYQDLGSYKEKINQQDNQPENQPKNQRGNSEIPCGTRSEGTLKNDENQQDDQPENQRKNQTITAFINSIININKTLKEYIVDAPVKNKNLSSIEDIKTFVDFASQTNALPQGMNVKILVSYFDCIRLTRSTCTISANILVKFIEKIHKYSTNQIHYAMWKHVEQHDDKKESYTLGIMRNTNEHEARRGLMKLKNKGGGNFEKLPGSSQDGSKYEYGF